MNVYHEEFGIGEVINSTEKLDESGALIAADVMFEHGIEQDLPLFEVSYSAKDAAAGKDIGKPGKEFKNIAAKAAAKYGSKEAGGRVAGAILKNLRKEGYEDSPADKAKDKKMEKKMGMSHAAFEKSAADKKQDAACEETEMTKEAAKWRNSSAVGSISSPEYNYDNMDVIHPKSTGVKKAKSDTPTAYSSLMSRPKPQFAKTGDRKGMVTKQHIDRLKSRIKAGQMEDFENDILDIVDEAINSALDEKLIGNQKKIDANKNGKIDAEDFKKLRKEEVSESVVVPPRMTPDSASMRMPAVESVVRDIMSQQRNLRQEAKVAEFKSRNK